MEERNEGESTNDLITFFDIFDKKLRRLGSGSIKAVTEFLIIHTHTDSGQISENKILFAKMTYPR